MMPSSVIVGLMTLCTVTCCPGSLSLGIFDSAVHPPKAVATTMPATNAPANPAVPFSLLFILFLLTRTPHLRPPRKSARKDTSLRPVHDTFPCLFRLHPRFNLADRISIISCLDLTCSETRSFFSQSLCGWPSVEEGNADS